MRYAKLVDGNPVYATNPLRIGTRHVYTTDPTPYGYKQVVRDAPTPPEGYVAVHDGWQETDTTISETYRMEPEYVAGDNVPKGDLFEVAGQYFLALIPITKGDPILENENAERVALSDAINRANMSIAELATS